MSADFHLYSAGAWLHVFQRRWWDMGPQTITGEDGCVFTEECGISGMSWGSTGLLEGLHGRLCSSGTAPNTSGVPL